MHHVAELKELECRACNLVLCISCGKDVTTPEARRAAHATCDDDGDDAECPLRSAFAIASAVENLSATLDNMRDKPSASRASGNSSRRQRSGGSSSSSAGPSAFSHGTSYAGDESDARAVTSAVEKAKSAEAARDVTLTEALQRLLRALCPPPAVEGPSASTAVARKAEPGALAVTGRDEKRIHDDDDDDGAGANKLSFADDDGEDDDHADDEEEEEDDGGGDEDEEDGDDDDHYDAEASFVRWSCALW